MDTTANNPKAARQFRRLAAIKVIDDVMLEFEFYGESIEKAKWSKLTEILSHYDLTVAALIKSQLRREKVVSFEPPLKRIDS